MQEDEIVQDGRRARGERTRLAVIEALLGLAADGASHPTARQVADRAGVALRTVYHHFEDVESLRGVAFGLQLDRHRELLQPVAADLPLHDRVVTVARQLRALFEAITPIRRTALIDERASVESQGRLGELPAIRRRHLESVFAPELAKRADRARVVDAIDVATSWQAWEFLRTVRARGPLAAERVLIFSLDTLLS
ncbi:MAG: TetR family transcriptional regulator [Actinomycetota bacterium]|nr:TetR family transcriptional regulator [Actinomycetota bacterium]